MKARRLDSSSDDSDEDGDDGNDPPYIIRDSFFEPQQIVPDESSVVPSSSEPMSEYRVIGTDCPENLLIMSRSGLATHERNVAQC